MITALRRRVVVQPGGQIEIRSSELEPGAVAEVIILIEQPASRQDRKDRLSALAALFKTTQALPPAQVITDEEIAAEIEAYRSGKQ